MKHNQDELLPALLKRCIRLMDNDIDQILRHHDIARSQYRVLYYVANLGEPSQSDLSAAMQIKASTLTLIIDALVRKGWLVRVRSASDKRINQLRLTASGRAKFRRIPDPARKLHQAIEKKLGQDESQTLSALLNKLILVLA